MCTLHTIHGYGAGYNSPPSEQVAHMQEYLMPYLDLIKRVHALSPLCHHLLAHRNAFYALWRHACDIVWTYKQQCTLCCQLQVHITYTVLTPAGSANAVGDGEGQHVHLWADSHHRAASIT